MELVATVTLKKSLVKKEFRTTFLLNLITRSLLQVKTLKQAVRCCARQAAASAQTTQILTATSNTAVTTTGRNGANLHFIDRM